MLNRRQFTAGVLVTGASLLVSANRTRAAGIAPKLPTVRWGKYEISRVLVGHNPIKGMSHFSPELDREMKEYFDDGDARAKAMLRRCEQLGINTCQMGGEKIEQILRGHYAEGGQLQWIATFYSKPGEGKEELARILKMRPKPIGAQHWGDTTDRLMRNGQIERARDTLKMLRDAGLLVGLCSHNHEVIDYVENKGWDVDFYQCSFYRSVDSLKPARRGEIFEEEARQSMARTIAQVSKPCLAYKVLGANRHCGTPADVEAALRFALTKIKPTDVVLLGMWQKHKDQVAEDVAIAQRVLSAV